MFSKLMIKASRTALVANVFVNSNKATLPAQSRSPIIPEPTIAASRNAVPIASLIARLLRLRLNGLFPEVEDCNRSVSRQYPAPANYPPAPQTPPIHFRPDL